MDLGMSTPFDVNTRGHIRSSSALVQLWYDFIPRLGTDSFGFTGQQGLRARVHAASHGNGRRVRNETKRG